MFVKAYKMVAGILLAGLGFITPDSLTQGDYMIPTPQVVQGEFPQDEQEPCTIQEVATTYQDGTTQVTTTWWGQCS